MDDAPIDLSLVSGLLPNRQLSHEEALVVAEVQALKLLRLGGFMCPAVSTLVLAKRAGVIVEFERSVGEVGATFHRNGIWYLWHASLDSAGMHATVTHQLKIILDYPFGDDIYPHQDVMAPGIRRHHVAEYFAACLTMPQEWIEQLWREGERDVNALALRFAVTPRAMAFRLRALRLLESGLVRVSAPAGADAVDIPASPPARLRCGWFRRRPR